MEEVKDILKSSNIRLPCPLTDFTFSDQPQEVHACTDAYLHLADWVKEHFTGHADRVNFFTTVFKKYGCNIVPPVIQHKMKQFMGDIFQGIKQKHPALVFTCLQSGSVGEGTKVFHADEFDFMSDYEMAFRFKLARKKSLQNVDLICTYTMPAGQLDTKTECQACKELLQLQEGKVLDRNMLLSHYYGACAEALDEPLLWRNNPSIYRLSASDITAANSSISCLIVAIHDSTYPWLEATIDIVPVFPIKTPTFWCKIPDFLEYRNCRAVAKWASDQPMAGELFQLGFSMCDAEMFRIMPTKLCDAYKLAKIAKDDKFCPAIKNTGMRAKEFITSYILKTITIMLYIEIRKLSDDDRALMQSTNDENGITPQHVYEIMCWSSAIYRILTVAFENGSLESVYLPGYNLFHIYEKYFQYNRIATEYARCLADIIEPPGKIPLVIQSCTEKCIAHAWPSDLSTEETIHYI